MNFIILLENSPCLGPFEFPQEYDAPQKLQVHLSPCKFFVENSQISERFSAVGLCSFCSGELMSTTSCVCVCVSLFCCMLICNSSFDFQDINTIKCQMGILNKKRLASVLSTTVPAIGLQSRRLFFALS